MLHHAQDSSFSASALHICVKSRESESLLRIFNERMGQARTTLRVMGLRGPHTKNKKYEECMSAISGTYVKNNGIHLCGDPHALMCSDVLRCTSIAARENAENCEIISATVFNTNTLPISCTAGHRTAYWKPTCTGTECPGTEIANRNTLSY